MDEIYGLVELTNVDDNHARWLELRNTGVGSSDIATIAGLNTFKSPLELWLEKTLKVPPAEDNDAMALGRHLEPFIGRLYSQRTNESVIPAKCLYRHPEYSFALASPDFWITANGSLGILECKNTSSRRAHEWETEIPLWAQIQLQWQMGVIGPRFGSIAALIGSNTHEFRHARFSFASDVFDQCLELASAFWAMVEQDIPPAPGPGDSRAIEALIGERHETTIELGPNELDMAQRYLAVQEQKKLIQKRIDELETEEREFRNRLLLAMGDHKYASLPNSPITIKATTVSVPEKLTKAYSFTRFDIRERKK